MDHRKIYVWYLNVHPYAHTHTIVYNEKSVYDVLRKQNEMLKWTDAEKMIVDRNCGILYTWEKRTRCTTNMHSCMPKLCINIMGINMIWQWLWYFLSSRLYLLNIFLYIYFFYEFWTKTFLQNQDNVFYLNVNWTNFIFYEMQLMWLIM